MSPTFPKSERLTGKKIIDEVFKSGRTEFLHPFRINFIPSENVQNHRILVSVPRRNFPRAVDRNLLKRRIREAYRLNKPQAGGKYFDIACLYIAKEILPYSLIEKKLSELLSRLE